VTEPFAEYREIRVTDPLRQGDVLEAVDSGASAWERHLLVITADCDFAHDKHQGRVTCVPLLRADEYLLELQMPALKEKYIVTKLIPTLRRALASVAPTVSDERLRAWPQEENVDTIIQGLGLTGNSSSEACAAFHAIRLLGVPCTSLDDAVLALLEAQLVGPAPKTRDNILRDITAALKATYTNPPGDAIFFSAVGHNHDAGYFAYLRHLEQIWEPEIAIGPTRSEVRYRRISRLRDRYTHATVHRFAPLYMSIGLPDEYEEARSLHSELLGEKYK